MYLGILIGMFIFGFLIFTANNEPELEKNQNAVILRVTGVFFVLIGFFGSVGWIIEILI